MGIRYYDRVSNEMRIKPRYIYFLVGVLSGCVLTLAMEGLFLTV